MDDSKISKRAVYLLSTLAILALVIFTVVLALLFKSINLNSLLPTDNSVLGANIATSINPTTNTTTVLKNSTVPVLVTGQNYPLMDVVDGDTVAINKDGKRTVIRLIGINTPELKNKSGVADCFAIEAKLALENEIGNKQLLVVTDPSQGELDKYQRLLAYVYIVDSDNQQVDLNLFMIKQGYAYEYTYSKPYMHQKAYKAAETAAKSKNLGLWGSCVVSYFTNGFINFS